MIIIPWFFYPIFVQFPHWPVIIGAAIDWLIDWLYALWLWYYWTLVFFCNISGIFTFFSPMYWWFYFRQEGYFDSCCNMLCQWYYLFIVSSDGLVVNVISFGAANMLIFQTSNYLILGQYLFFLSAYALIRIHAHL